MKKTLISIIVFLLLIIIFLIIILLGHEEVKTVEWFSVTSPDGNYSIEVDRAGDSFTFGSQDIKVRCIDNFHENENKSQMSTYLYTSIANDGKELREENFSLEWIDGGAQLTFDGEEQPPVTYVIYWEHVFQESSKSIN